MKEKIQEYFGINRLGSSIGIEILAGISTFMSLAYIFVVNPSILAEAGIDRSAVFFATVVISGVFTILMGLWAKLPFALAPGLEMDSYVSFFIVAVLGFTWQQSLGVVFYSTTIFFILSFIGIREKIVNSIPDNMKHNLAASVGMFLIMIGLKLANIITFNGSSPSGIGSFTSPYAIALYAGIAIIFVLEKIKFRASVIVSIILVSIYCSSVGVSDNAKPAEISSEMFSAMFKLDLSVITNPKCWGAILILFLVDFYGSVAKILGLTVNTSILTEIEGKVTKQVGLGLWVDGLAALFSPLFGTSSVTTFVESGVGIGVGGRTGLTAIVCGILMLCCFLLVPLIKFVPVVATSASLLFVGYQLMPRKEIWAKFTTIDKVILALMLIAVATQFSLERAMLIGYLFYIIDQIFIQKLKPNLYLIISFVLLFLGVFAKYFFNY